MEEPTQLTVDSPRPKHSKKKIVIIVLIIAALIAGGIGAYCYFSNPYDKNASSISYANASDAEIQAELDKKTEDSRLWVSVASHATVKQGTKEMSSVNSKGETIPVLNNLSDNTRDIKYTLTLDDGTVIYESDLIKPGQSITKPEIKDTIASGTYQVIATAQGYDPDTHNAVGGPISAVFTLTVE